MSTNSGSTGVQKVTVSLPRALIDRLDEIIPRRQRSRFIATAIQEQLAILEQIAILEKTAGAWTDQNHPDMKTEDDIDRWLEGLRTTWPESNHSNG